MPMGLMISHFIRHYGFDCYQNPLYPTADKIIPVRRFFVMYNAMVSSLAIERSNMLNAAVLGHAMANSPKDKWGPVQKQLDELDDEIHGVSK